MISNVRGLVWTDFFDELDHKMPVSTVENKWVKIVFNLFSHCIIPCYGSVK